MVPLSIRGMTGWVNPCCLPVRRPWILFVARRRSTGAFFDGPSQDWAQGVMHLSLSPLWKPYLRLDLSAMAAAEPPPALAIAAAP
jgi:hypothetical protein